MNRILVAVNDSPTAFDAAALAIKLARGLHTELHFVAVAESEDHTASAIHHVTELAERAGITSTSTTADGANPFEVLLRVAKEWNADLIVMGRSDRRRPGVPYLGSQTEHLLEFTHIPVLVVPHTDRETTPDASAEAS